MIYHFSQVYLPKPNLCYIIWIKKEEELTSNWMQMKHIAEIVASCFEMERAILNRSDRAYIDIMMASAQNHRRLVTVIFSSCNRKIYTYIRGSLNKCPDFLVCALLLIVHTRNSSPLRSDLLRLQCTCTVPTISGRPHESPLVWACQWPSSQPISSPQLSVSDSLWA